MPATMADLENLQKMFRSLEIQARQKVIAEIHAFANDYHHHMNGFDVVRVDQLLDFLKDVPNDQG
jgi:ribulose bisphosphate carboxylase small subunit